MNFVEGRSYSRREIGSELGGNNKIFISMRDGKVLYGAFKTPMNPEAPNIILVERGRDRERAAEALEGQKEPIRVFIKRGSSIWEYRGWYRLVRRSTDPALIAEHAQRAGRE